MSGWTPDRDAALLALQSKGLSTSQIAVRLGNGVTRSAVIGRLQRIGPKLENNRWTAAQIEQLTEMAGAGRSVPECATALGLSRSTVRLKATALAISFRQVSAVAKQQFTPKISKPLPAEKPAAIKPLMLRLEELRADQCKWPIGDPKQPDFGFCGHPVARKCYCSHHFNRSVIHRVQ